MLIAYCWNICLKSVDYTYDDKEMELKGKGENVPIIINVWKGEGSMYVLIVAMQC
jgi:hypothetical protein